MQVIKSEDMSGQFFELVSIKDLHANFGFANRIRVTHQNDLKAKIEFIKDYCQKHRVANLIITGDVTDTNEENKWTFKQYRLNKAELLGLRSNGLTIWSPAGNHDMFNGLATTEETVFGEFVKEGVVKYLTKEPILLSFNPPASGAIAPPLPGAVPGAVQVQEPKNIGIFGIDYSKHIELVKEQLNNVHLSQFDLKIVVMHSHCTPSEVAVTDFTYENLIKEFPSIDVFICGHYHGGFPTWVFTKANSNGHVAIVNNWSIQRVVRDYYNEMDIHTPEMEHIKIGWSQANNDFIISFETVRVPHKPYNEAFRPKAIELLKVTKREQFEFFNSVNFEDIPTGTDDVETLKLISQKDGVSDIVVAKALNYLNNVVVQDIE